MQPADLIAYPSLVTEEEGDTDANRGVKVVVAALLVGPNIKPIRETTRVPIGWLQNASWYLRQAGLWSGDRPSNYRLDYQWLGYRGSTLQVAIVADALVAAGRLVSTANDDGVRLYRRRDVGDFTPWGELGMAWEDWVHADDREARRIARHARARKRAASAPTPNVERPHRRLSPRPWCHECGASERHERWCTQRGILPLRAR